jgi:CDP-diacylglycerol--glycerol-3-phosphate 3-phosphatidyltransferase
MTISNDSRARIKRTFEPIALGMGRLGLTPDALTLIGFAITVGGAALIAAQLWLAGGLVILFGGAFDMFDGTLARATGRVSKLGAFMDSVFDRAGEVIVYLGLVVGLEAAGVANGSLLAAAALGSAVMVSYTRSKSEGLGFTSGTGMAAVGIMPREVRIAILSAGLVLAGALGPSTGYPVLQAALAIIAVGATITVIQRILHVRGQAKQQSTQNV